MTSKRQHGQKASTGPEPKTSGKAPDANAPEAKAPQKQQNDKPKPQR